jgi:glycosyltransferase involved in cell wall biosynthesis
MSPGPDCISVVVPTKDRLAYLRRYLPLYLREPEVAEVIVVVDGSTDGTQHYLASLSAVEPRVTVVDNGVNRGTPFTKNRGLEAASSEYVFMAEDDLEITPGFFRTLLDHLAKTDADVICGRNIFRFESESEAEAIARCDALTDPPYDLRRIAICTSVRLPDDAVQPMIAAPMLGRTDVIGKIGFDERYRVNFWREETDFQFAAQEAGFRLASCPHAICFNYVIENDRSGSHSAIGLRRVMWMTINNWRFIRKYRSFIAENFAIGNPYLYIARFGGERLTHEVLLPALARWKRRLLGAAKRVA